MGFYGWFSPEEKQLKKLDLHVQLCPCRQSSLPSPHFSLHELICPDSCQISPLLELALALPQFCPFRVHSSSLWCFFSLILGVNYMDIKLFIEKYNFNQLIEVLEDTSIYGARIHPPNAKLHLDINHLQTILKNTEARGNSMMSVIIFFFFAFFFFAFLTHAPLECLPCSVPPN